MTNKQQINKLKDNAELAWASYGYFHYFLEQHNKPDYIDKVHYIDAKDENGKDKLDNNNKKVKRPIEITDILDMNYKKCDVFEYNSFLKRYDRIGTLDGDFGKIQLQQFFERYDLLKHCPNTDSGFSATLFKDTKADSKDLEYTLAIRGTEFKLDQIQDLLNDYYIGTNNSDMNRVIEQY
ncbi:hypothetical protein, partial [Helicobacter bilis]